MAVPQGGIPRPGVNYIDGILWGVKWNTGASHTVTYSLFQGPVWYNYEAKAVVAAFQTWANVANVKFSYAGINNTAADMWLGLDSADPSILGAFTPPIPGDPSYGTGVFNYLGVGWNAAGLQKGGFGFGTLIHELGHGLGLAHPHDNGGGSPTYAQLGIGSLDDSLYTVMSYHDIDRAWNSYQSGRADWESFGQAGTPMAFDIAAVQYLYGANTSYNLGNTTYTLLTHHYECIWDAGGTDTISAAGLALNTVLDLNEGTYLSHAAGAYGGYTVAFNARIENAIGGSGHDSLTGNALANAMSGGAGRDSLVGAAGNDTLDGGAHLDLLKGGVGDDTYLLGDADSVVEGKAQGLDTVRSSVTNTLANYVENMILTGSAAANASGNAWANTLTGNGGANRLNGDAANDSLDGAAGADTLTGGTGADTMRGGLGDDTYAVDVTTDSVVEGGGTGSGIDTVRSSLSYVLGANLERVILLGAANLTGTGNSLANLLTGNTGANLLNGAAGADTMAGGTGDDTYVVNLSTEQVTEAAAAGTDTVRSTGSFVLAPNVEALILLGAAHLNGTGNASNNTLTGNGGNNILDGAAGADLMVGNGGHDNYRVDHLQDQVIEAANGGTDLVRSSVDFTLATNLENLTLLASAAGGTGNTAANHLVGNTVANLLQGLGGNDSVEGGSGNDTLRGGGAADTLLGGGHHDSLAGDGGADSLSGAGGADTLDGGAGADTLAGGAGDDTYYRLGADDQVIEAADQGRDTVQSAVTVTLAANIEAVTLLDTNSIDATGNELANTLTGNAGDNVLDGTAGADSMAGGDGNDTYRVDSIGDQVAETGTTNSAADRVESTVDYTLGANLDDLTLTGSADVDGTGNAGANALTGNAGANQLAGGLGNDTLDGGTGIDTYLHAIGDGQDLVHGADGTDHLRFTGTDLFDWGNVSREGNDLILAALSEDTSTTSTTGSVRVEGHYAGTSLAYFEIDVGATKNQFYSANDDLTRVYTPGSLTGTNQGADAELIIGSAGNDSIVGNGGRGDWLFGGEGADSITAGTGHDLLGGGAGADTLAGGTGADTLTGGEGADRFVFIDAGEGVDSVTVFTTGTGGDLLDIADLLDGFQSGTSQLSDFVQLANDGTHTTVQVNADAGAGGFQDLCVLQNVTAVSLDDLSANIVTS